MLSKLVPEVLFSCDEHCFDVLLFLVMMWTLFVTLIVYDCLLWLWSPLPTTVPWVHGPPSSC